jgi:hypothetical protein
MFKRADVFGIGLVFKSLSTGVNHIKGWTLTLPSSGPVRIRHVHAQNASPAKVALFAAMKSARLQMIKDISVPNDPISEQSEESWPIEPLLQPKPGVRMLRPRKYLQI